MTTEFSFNDVVGFLTLMAVVIGLIEAFRRMGRERKADRNEVIKEVVEQILRETSPKLDNVQHELTSNGGTSQKDKIELMVKEVGSLRNEMRVLGAKVDKISVQGEFWAKECVTTTKDMAKLGERVTVVEVAANSKGRMRWRFS